MKRFLFIILIAVSISACANGRHPYHGGYWIPALVGGVVISTMPSRVYEQPHYELPPSVYYPPNYGGSPYGYHYGSIYDSYCGCYKTVLLPN